jgi:hypothetical protein
MPKRGIFPHIEDNPGFPDRIIALMRKKATGVSISVIGAISLPTVANGQASVGVLDQVLVTTDPFAEISIAHEGVKINFAGRLQESGNLLNWSDVSPQPASPFVFPKSPHPRFFRVEK